MARELAADFFATTEGEDGDADRRTIHLTSLALDLIEGKMQEIINGTRPARPPLKTVV